MIDGVTSPRLRGVLALGESEVPGFAVKFKNESSWMKFLAIFANLFNKSFMTTYTTTSDVTVYFPSREYLLADQEGNAQVLAHEIVHMRERRQDGLAWNFLRYSFPQLFAVLAIASIGAIWNLWFLLALVFLLALAPLPAPGRRDIELNGYTMSMAIAFWTSGTLSDELYNNVADQFTTSLYWFMWPWRKDMLFRLKMRGQSIRTGDILKDPLFRKVYDIYMSR